MAVVVLTVALYSGIGSSREVAVLLVAAFQGFVIDIFIRFVLRIYNLSALRLDTEYLMYPQFLPAPNHLGVLSTYGLIVY